MNNTWSRRFLQKKMKQIHHVLEDPQISVAMCLLVPVFSFRAPTWHFTN